MIVTFANGRVVRGELNGNGGPCSTVARASDVLRMRRRSMEAIYVFPRNIAGRNWPDNFEKVDPESIVGLEAEFLAETLPGRRRQPQALVTWRIEDEPPEEDEPAPQADWRRALPTGGW